MNPMLQARLINEEVYKYVINTRTLRMGVATTSGKTPDVLFGEAGPVKQISSMNTGTSRGWATGSPLLSAFLSGDPNVSTIIGLCPYIPGDVTEV